LTIYFSPSDKNWQALPEADDFFSRITPLDGTLSLDSAVSLWSRPLSFYSKIKLLMLSSQNWANNLHVFFLLDGEELYRLDGTSPPIHQVNSQAPIVLTENNVLEYLKYFCFFVRGDLGPFYTIDDLSDPLIAEAVLTHSDENGRGLANYYKPPQLFGKNELGQYRASALIYYSDTIFHGDFLIDPGGLVEMVSDQALLTQLPEQIRVPLTLKGAEHLVPTSLCLGQ